MNCHQNTKQKHSTCLAPSSLCCPSFVECQRSETNKHNKNLFSNPELGDEMKPPTNGRQWFLFAKRAFLQLARGNSSVSVPFHVSFLFWIQFWLPSTPNPPQNLGLKKKASAGQSSEQCSKRLKTAGRRKGDVRCVFFLQEYSVESLETWSFSMFGSWYQATLRHPKLSFFSRIPWVFQRVGNTTNSQTIHGTGISTYMFCWFLW